MIRNNNKHISFEVASALLSYDVATGDLRWKSKDGTKSWHRSWNARYAGKIAGTLDRDGYRRLVINGKHFAAHRIAWLLHHGKLPENELDHMERVKSVTDVNKLREASHSLNMYNRAAYAASGSKGVSKVGKKWRADIMLPGRKKKYLGTFATIDQAAAAYSAAEAARS